MENNGLSKAEFQYMFNMMEIYSPWFIESDKDQEVLSDILRKMRRSKKLEFSIRLRLLWNKSPDTTKYMYAKGRKALGRAGVIKFFDQTDPFALSVLRVNALVVLRAIRYISMRLSITIACGGRIRLEEMIRKLEDVWEENGWEEEPVQITDRILRWISHVQGKSFGS